MNEAELKGPLMVEIRGAVGRGWCADANREKEMDVVLAEAIATEVFALVTEQVTAMRDAAAQFIQAQIEDCSRLEQVWLDKGDKQLAKEFADFREGIKNWPSKIGRLGPQSASNAQSRVYTADDLALERSATCRLLAFMPDSPHEGPCGPEAGCDGKCMDRNSILDYLSSGHAALDKYLDVRLAQAVELAAHVCDDHAEELIAMIGKPLGQNYSKSEEQRRDIRCKDQAYTARICAQRIRALDSEDEPIVTQSREREIAEARLAEARIWRGMNLACGHKKDHPCLFCKRIAELERATSSQAKESNNGGN